MKKFSVLIVVKSGKHLEKLINSIGKLRYPKNKIEIIFLDNNCDRNTSILLKKLTKINSYFKVIKVSKDLNIPEARNYLLKFAKGKFIVFTDHDVILEPEWLRKFRKRFEEGYDMVGGIMDSKQEEILAKAENIRKKIWYDYANKYGIFHFETANVAFRKKILSEFTFDEKARFAEDLDFTNRVKNAGFKLKFDKDIYVYHHHRTNLKNYLKTIFKYGISHAYVDKKEKIVDLRKKLKIGWYFLSPLMIIISSFFIGYWSLLFFLSFFINKYSIPSIKNIITKKDVSSFLVLFLEPLRFLVWSYGFVLGVMKNE